MASQFSGRILVLSREKGWTQSTAQKEAMRGTKRSSSVAVSSGARPSPDISLAMVPPVPMSKIFLSMVSPPLWENAV